MTWVSDGHCWRFRPHYGVKTSRGPRNRVDKDVVFIDVDSNVVILDAPDFRKRKHRKSRVVDKKDSADVICLDVDDDDDYDCDSSNGEKLDRNLSDGASTSKRSGAGSDNAGSSSDGEADAEDISFVGEHPGSNYNADGIKLERMFIPGKSTSKRDTKGKHTPPVKLSKGKRTYSGKSTPDTDCELMEDCFIIREQWEKASSKRKLDTRNGQSDAEHPQVIVNEARQKDKGVNEYYQHEKDGDSESDNETEDDSDCKILKENVIPVSENLYSHGEADHAGWKAFPSEEPPCNNDDDFSRRMSEKDGSSSFTEEDKEINPSNANEENPEYVSNISMNSGEDARPMSEKDGSSSFTEEDEEINPPNANEETPEYVSNISMNSGEDAPFHDNDASEGCMKGDREKYKETDEYKKALAEELAHRDEALRIQAEAAQNLRRQRKRERAESMRLLDMERRQKQRIEEMRETQKKDEEDMNLKEAIRASVRKNLLHLEQSCYSMSSLLQGLGIIQFGTFPSQNEVRVAYKKALLTFHPDRASKSDMQQLVEAEEKFKLISRMKDKFQLAF